LFLEIDSAATRSVYCARSVEALRAREFERFRAHSVPRKLRTKKFRALQAWGNSGAELPTGGA
jgi:hypothetical protein